MTEIKLAALLVLAFAVAGCGDEGDKKTTKGDSGTPSGWQAAVGADGTFAQTFDSVTWSTRTLTARDLFAVACVGNMDGWAAGENGYVARTKDGGETWKEQQPGTNATLRTIHFVQDHHEAMTRLTGVVAGESGFLAVSIDGGEHWTPAKSGTEVTLRGSGAAFDADLIVVVGDGGTVLRSVDLGKTWDRTVLAGAGDLRSVDVVPNGSLVLTVDSKGQVWGSKDLGKTFALETTAGAALNGVAASQDGAKALAGGDQGIALRRDASGQWSETPTGTEARLNAAMITHDGQREYLAGEGGTLLGAVGLGQWQKPALGTNAALFGLEDLDPH